MNKALHYDDVALVPKYFDGPTKNYCIEVYAYSNGSLTRQAFLYVNDASTINKYWNTISLSDDGNSIAIGEMLYTLRSGVAQGRASVWTYNGTTWTQKGNYVFGDNNFSLNYQ